MRIACAWSVGVGRPLRLHGDEGVRGSRVSAIWARAVVLKPAVTAAADLIPAVHAEVRTIGGVEGSARRRRE